MARPDRRHPVNAEGDWYVDTRCIDCDVARQYAPDHIIELDGLSVVARQPAGPDDELPLWRAALACPTRSIGTLSGRRPPPGLFPWELDDGVHLCGHNDERSFGAHSYLAVRPEGNVLVDSPRFTRQLVGPIADAGGLAHVLLTHRDDVADAQRWAEHFGADVWVHEADRAAAPFATQVVSGEQPVEVRAGLVVLPVPGHTNGSVCYLLDERHLFTGDSLYWNRSREHLDVFGSAAWYSWEALTTSMGRLAGWASFEWVLPGHGMWHRADRATMAAQLRRLASDMAAHDRRSWDHRA